MIYTRKRLESTCKNYCDLNNKDEDSSQDYEIMNLVNHFFKKILDEKVQKIINSSRNHNFKQIHLKDKDFDIY